MKTLKPESIYGKTVKLKTTLEKVECWNFVDNATFTLPAGTLVKLKHVHDTTSTVVEVVNKRGVCCGILIDGRRGFRFVINNEKLAKATGLKVPKITQNLIGQMIAFESGQMSDEQVRSLLTALKECGWLNELQGYYGRTAKAMGII